MPTSPPALVARIGHDDLDETDRAADEMGVAADHLLAVDDPLVADEAVKVAAAILRRHRQEARGILGAPGDGEW